MTQKQSPLPGNREPATRASMPVPVTSYTIGVINELRVHLQELREHIESMYVRMQPLRVDAPVPAPPEVPEPDRAMSPVLQELRVLQHQIQMAQYELFVLDSAVVS